MRVKKNSSDIILILIFFLMAILISIAGYSKGEFDLIQKISNNFLSENAMSISGSLRIQDYKKTF